MYYNPNFNQFYPNYGTPQTQLPQTYTQPSYQNFTQPQNVINGKIVDTVDMVKAIEVPLGGYGVFPKADMNEIYVKSWNQNGTTNIITFKPIASSPESPNNEITEDLKAVLDKIKGLEEKIDSIIIPKEKTKGVDVSEY